MISDLRKYSNSFDDYIFKQKDSFWQYLHFRGDIYNPFYEGIETFSTYKEFLDESNYRLYERASLDEIT